MSRAGECRNVCIVKPSHFRGSLHLFGPLADQVDDFPDEIWTNVEAL